MRFATLLGATLFLSLACGLPPAETHPHHHHSHVAQHAQPVIFLTPMYSSDSGWTGRYAYENSGNWFYYNFPMTTPPILVPDSPPNNPKVVEGTNPYSAYGTTIPAGGTWATSKAPPPEEEVEGQELMSVAQDVEGAPAVEGWETEVDAEAGEGNMIEVDEPAADANDGDASSGDAGSSDGGGGGGDGGGGE